MNLKCRFLCLFLTLFLVTQLSACRTIEENYSSSPSTVLAPDILRAVNVLGSDYPSSEPMSIDDLQIAAETVIDFAVENSLNALLYQVNPHGEALYLSDVLPLSSTFDFSPTLFRKIDPLQVLIDAAKKQNIAVYAVFSPYPAGSNIQKPVRNSIAYKNPNSVVSIEGEAYYRPDTPDVHDQAVLAVAELAQNYDLAGIVLSDVDDGPVSDYPAFYTYLNALVSDISDVVKSVSDKQIQLGMFLSDQAEESDNRTVFLENACRTSIDFILPQIYASTEGGKSSDYAQALSRFATLGIEFDTSLYAVLSDASYKDIEEYRQSLWNNNMLGITGGVIDTYSNLTAENEEFMETTIPFLYIEEPILPDISLEIPQEFCLTRPLDGNRLTVSSSTEKYYITGTSDPEKAVYCDGEEVERISNNGTFGVLVDVQPGENTYIFEQDGETISATLYRTLPNAVTRISKISTYTNGAQTVFQPYGPQVVSKDLPMIFQCTAPSGGEVTAILNGQSYTLEQTTEAQDGVPVVFKKEVKIKSDDPDSITSAGYVTYELVYDGEVSQVQAPGEVFLVGDNRKPFLRVKSGMGTVLNPSMESGDFMTTLKTGSVAEITGQTANYFKTSFGGAIQKIETEIITDLTEIHNNISGYDYQINANGDESIILHGTNLPSFIVTDSGAGSFEIQLMDTSGLQDGAIEIESSFFSDVDVHVGEDDSLTLTFHAGKQEYFGYNVTYEGNDTIISFKAPPQLSSVKGRPLLGLNVVIDPGHGALDTGALGVSGTTGPTEKNVNMYAAHITQKLMKGLGANVYLTRQTDEEFLELDERVRFTEEHDADFFISIHHNSVVETINPENIEGTWVYYYNDISSEIAQSYLDNITKATNRKSLGTEKAWYVVCRNTLAPSVLLELGFMPNPAEYEEICNQENMVTVAQAICDGLVDYIENLQNTSDS